MTGLAPATLAAYDAAVLPSSTLVELETATSRENGTAFLDGTGVIGDLVRTHDWSGTALGAIASWPVCLKVTVATMLRSHHPMFLWWGPELVQLYNEAYVPCFGAGKHPAAMGQAARVCWPEIWEVIGPEIDGVMTDGRASHHEDAMVPVFRNGHLEEVHWTYGYSPVVDENGGPVRGTLVVCAETTARVLVERRSKTLRALALRLAACPDEAAIRGAVHAAADDAPLDIAFALTFDPGSARLGTSSALDDALQITVRTLAEAELREHGTESPRLVALPASSTLPGGSWPERATHLFLVPGAGESPTWALGISPRLVFDRPYRDFLEQFCEEQVVRLAQLAASRAQREADRQRRDLLLHAPMPAALLRGPEHVFELANAPFDRMIGGRELVGKKYLDAFPELAKTEFPGILDRVFLTGERYVSPESLFPLDRDGDGRITDCYFTFTLEALRDGRDQVYGIMSIAVDITEQVNARRSAEVAAAEREMLVRQLEAAGSAKDQFLATISHELRTPLTAILGWARLLDDHSEPARLRRGLAVIERSATTQAQLIEDLLDVSRIVSGKIRMTLDNVELRPVIEAAVDTVRRAAEAKDIHIRVLVDGPLGCLIADETRLQQVVWNLLVNAVKFTPRGGEIQLAVRRSDTSVSITVRDNGRGILPELLPRVFERFQQDDGSTTRQQAGLGLGLAIVRHLVELHDGRVSVESEGEGRGATFVVELPTRAAAAVADFVTDRESARHPVGRAPDRQPLHAVHVLLVDDDDDTRELVALVLEDAGATVTPTSSVAAAATVLATSTVSMIISDVGMSGEDGYALMKRVRSPGSPIAGQGIPALALTAYAGVEDRERALAGGFHDHLAKPVDPKELVSAVVALLTPAARGAGPRRG